MKKIFKYQLGITAQQIMDLPINSEILRVDTVDGMIYLWAKVNPESINTERVIEMYKTGQEIENDHELSYLGFASVKVGQELGLYIFERITKKYEIRTATS